MGLAGFGDGCCRESREPISLKGNPLSATAQSKQLPELRQRLFDVLAEKN